MKCLLPKNNFSVHFPDNTTGFLEYFFFYHTSLQYINMFIHLDDFQMNLQCNKDIGM